MARTKHGVELSADYVDEKGYSSRTGRKNERSLGSEVVLGKLAPVSLASATSILIGRAHAATQIGDNTESPIEQQLGAAIWMYFDRHKNQLKLCLMVDFNDAPDELLLVPQFAWSYYRSDWAILNPKRAGGLLIECDGKEFHSTSEQIAHDKKKDQAAHDHGYLTMRFTGTQIFKQADECAGMVYETVCGGN